MSNTNNRTNTASVPTANVAPLNIRKPSDPITPEQLDIIASRDCRIALMDYFEKHDDSKYNPTKSRLFELIEGTDFDPESKRELTKVFIHEPPPQPYFSITARPLSEFMKPPTTDPAELIKHRFLCKGGGMLLVGQTGLGKSSLEMQIAIKFSLGQTCFGLEPARPLKSLIVQAENDDGDVAEMKDGVFTGLGLTLEEQVTASKSVFVMLENEKTGSDLFVNTITPLLIAHKPDLLWIDPALSYIKGDMNSQEAVGRFLRNQLNPVLVKHNCGGIVIHHTNKPIANPDKLLIDPAYLGAGSAEWANWARGILALRKTDATNLYELIAGKRGARLRWKSADGESMCFSRYLSQSKRTDVIYWLEMALAEAETLKATNGKKTEDVLKLVPESGLIGKDDLISLCRKSNIGKNMADDLVKELMNDGKLFEHHAKRLNARPKVLLGRQANDRKEMVMLDLYTRNSQGIYLLPCNN